MQLLLIANTMTAVRIIYQIHFPELWKILDQIQNYVFEVSTLEVKIPPLFNISMY